NGEAIYATRMFTPYHEGDKIYYTRSKDNKFVYMIHIGWPTRVTAKNVTSHMGSKIFMLGVQEPVTWHKEADSLVIDIPPAFNDKIPCEYAFAFKIEQDVK
nr:alpha-L-fucosidase C-terminal domain-containing protein [Candidatus Sigynarchaeota archaeon]